MLECSVPFLFTAVPFPSVSFYAWIRKLGHDAHLYTLDLGMREGLEFITEEVML